MTQVKSPMGPDSDQSWETLNESADVAAVCQAWLHLLAPSLERLAVALVILKGVNEDTFRPIAIWPDPGTDVSSLLDIAQQVLEQRQCIESRAPVTFSIDRRVYPSQLAMPIVNSGVLYGAVVIGLSSRTGENLRHVRQSLALSIGWLIQLFWRVSYIQSNFGLESSALLLDLRLQFAESQDFQEALLNLLNHLATRLRLQRVSLGWAERDQVEVKAISHTAHFKYRHEAVQLLANAMQEAFDQRRDIVWPAAEQAPSLLINDDHRLLINTSGAGAAASFPLQIAGRIRGILTFEYQTGRPPTADDLRLGAALAAQVAPIALDKWRLDHWFAGKLNSKCRQGAQALFGSDHPFYKLAGCFALLLLLGVLFITGEFRITANTVIEGLVQRAAVAPFDGYIGQAMVRAGDSIRAGQVVATLDDKDLRLEKARLEGEAAQAQRKYRDAMAKHERADAGVLGAKVDQTQAELALVNEKLERASIKAPFDGYVVSGDLSQELGAPVEQGKVLFEITPLDAYRLILKVDERDIEYVAAGQDGQLTLTGVAGLKLPFTVKKITPIAIAEEGVNYFRVEADLTGDKPVLRPGMEGVGKIGAGQERLCWLWTRRLSGWLRVALWTWLP